MRYETDTQQPIPPPNADKDYGGTPLPDVDEPESGTAQLSCFFADAEPVIDRILSSSANEYFEEGKKSHLSRNIAKAIQLYGVGAVVRVTYWITKGKLPSATIAEIVKWVGASNDRYSRTYIRWMLETVLLTSTDVYVRDAANVGLALLDDPVSIPKLEAAIKNETSQAMRTNLQQTLAQLEQTKQS